MLYLILGNTEARDGSNTPLPLGGARLRALLTALAIRSAAPTTAPGSGPGHGHRHAPVPVPVPDLIDEVWGDDPPREAPAALQALVARLRRALGGRDTVLADPAGGYRLAVDGPDDVDLHRFTRLARLGAQQLAGQDPATAAGTLRSALALWRGPAFADLAEPARTAHAAVAEAHRRAALRDRIEADLRSGRTAPATLLPEIEALIHESPYDEPLRAQQLRALRAAGRPAEALAAYDRTRRTLADALGADPGPELAALHAELLRPTPPPPADTPAPIAVPQGNLRPRLTSFVGREPELAALQADLARLRLITLTGPGGSGKTRLAEHAAAAYAAAPPPTDDHHPDPVWLVELARLDHPAAVPGAVLSALGLRESSLVAREKAVREKAVREKTAPEDATTLLVEHCANRRLLLVLDNCEHVIAAAADLADRLLAHCPGVRILATSREPLGVPGETIRPVEPLPPAPAHRLFADRAAAARPGFTPAEDPAAVAEICARLDGLPLAIELAAARLRLLTPRQIADRLDDRFRLLTSGSRTLLPRQQTLRAVVDWSWDLLDEPERTVLRRLSVFAGGCDLTAAEAVCAEDRDLDVADLLGSLVDKSLVLAEPAGPAGMRYRMLETIHEYATERAAEHTAAHQPPPTTEAPPTTGPTPTALRHAAHFAALAEEAEPHLRSGDQLPWIRRIETELDNLRAALHTAVTHRDSDTAHRLVFALGWFWWLRNYRDEGSEWATEVLAVTPPDPPEGSPEYWSLMRLHVLRVFLLAEGRAIEEFDTPEYAALCARITEAFGHGSPETARFPGMLWPMAAYLTGGVLGFHAHLDTTVESCRRYGGDWELGVTLMLRTHVAIDITGGLPTVDADIAELREIAGRVGDRWTRSTVASAAGELALSRGRYDEARAEYEECLRLAREVGAYIEAPFALVRIAEASFSAGEFDTAERLVAQADREADEYGVASDVRAYSRLISSLLALFRGDLDRARTECELARAEAGKVTGPPQLTAGLDNIDSLLTARTQGPAAALARIAPALASAVAGHCAERVLAALAETAACQLADVGRPAEAVRVFAAATAWRAGNPRSVPEAAALAEFPARTRAALGARDHAREEAAGAALTPSQAATLVSEAARALPQPLARPLNDS
ncbi:BTAD domain-containing putative transcriptional regulator [Streptomyces sp. NBC_00503]|uniref:BTAD domain-containing putative transcriptional regulator n=1 Tax=Streptomyces sp. NBC_00503 TaxID=2903659 RepID=UPI002E81E14B|nr:BTAD domain-containing putative transcriptional regulator [Streptomyces sp. NBC_00503]WUD82198.1 AAA family ATPase [Streptomyces sp. NBC_00503]